MQNPNFKYKWSKHILWAITTCAKQPFRLSSWHSLDRNGGYLSRMVAPALWMADDLADRGSLTIKHKLSKTERLKLIDDIISNIEAIMEHKSIQTDFALIQPCLRKFKQNYEYFDFSSSVHAQIFEFLSLHLQHQKELIHKDIPDEVVFFVEDEEDLERYCNRQNAWVADLFSLVLKDIPPDLLEVFRANHYCLQIVNILKDVEKDAKLNQIYIPRSLCDKYGVTKEMFFIKNYHQSFKNLMCYIAEVHIKEKMSASNIMQISQFDCKKFYKFLNNTMFLSNASNYHYAYNREKTFGKSTFDLPNLKVIFQAALFPQTIDYEKVWDLR